MVSLGSYSAISQVGGRRVGLSLGLLPLPHPPVALSFGIGTGTGFHGGTLAPVGSSGAGGDGGTSGGPCAATLAAATAAEATAASARVCGEWGPEHRQLRRREKFNAMFVGKTRSAAKEQLHKMIAR